MLLKLTLVANRCDQDRYARLIRYERTGDRVVPYLVIKNHRGVTVKCTRVDYSTIGPTPLDPVLDRPLIDVWLNRVHSQRAHLRAA